MNWHLNYLALAVPFFIGFILLEYYYSRKKGLPYFELHNTVANISIGIAERLTDVLIAGYFYYVYDYIQHRYGLFNIKPGIAWWLLLFLLTDFIWYWYHRLAHELNILWLVHVVHHQSEDFNYSVSARITVFQALVRTAFWSVLPFIGFPAPMITSLLLLHGLYPFFIHTRTIGKLGFLEYILVTPSHHRVHHASNEKYLDKNYGDVLIIWDKLLGTFQKEEEEPIYGLTKPLKTHSFLWQLFHFWIELAIALKSQKTIKGKFKILFSKPNTLDPTLREKAETLFHIKHNPSPLEKPLNRYVIIQIALLLVALSIFISLEAYTTTLFKTGFTLLVLLTLINCGAIMEQKKWVFQIELARASLLLLIPIYYPSYPMTTFLLLFSIAGFFIYYYHHIEKYYLSRVYRSQQHREEDV